MQSVEPVAFPESQRGDYALSSDPRDRLVAALDVGSASEALLLADQVAGRCRWVKVGMELFYAEGRDLIARLQDRGFRIFLDLKLHDIPNTAAAAVRSVAPLGAELLTLHTAGGAAMLETAVAQVKILHRAPLLAGVTVLTSMNEAELHAIGVEAAPQEQVLRLATLALQSGLAGLVSSPLEVLALRQHFGPAPILIVPGVRPAGSTLNDQQRTATPEQAIRDGASLLVVGRPITRAIDPSRAAEAILEEMARGLERRPVTQA